MRPGRTDLEARLIALKRSGGSATNDQGQAENKRRSQRSAISGCIDIQTSMRKGEGKGRLLDISLGGAAVVYGPGGTPTVHQLFEGDELILMLDGRARLPGRVVRLFEGGYAVEFDWSLEMERDLMVRPSGVPGFSAS